MEDIKQLSQALREMQNRVIGLFRPKYYPTDQYIPVIADADGVLTCVEVSTLLGLSTFTIGKESGRYVPFPDNRMEPGKWADGAPTLTRMMSEPMKFHEWYEEHIMQINHSVHQ